VTARTRRARSASDPTSMQTRVRSAGRVAPAGASRRRWAPVALLGVPLFVAAAPRAVRAQEETPPELRIAFLGDQGLGGDADGGKRPGRVP